MRRATLPEKLSIAATLLVASCTSDHRVSPWGGQPGPTLAPFAPRPDLEARLAAVDAETTALELKRVYDIRVKLPRGDADAVIRGYDGTDVAGRAVHAVRVATPLGVVMAVGPLDVGDIERREATELLPALIGGDAGKPGAFLTGNDLNGDGRLDVVLRSDSGAIAIWHFDGLGSGAYEIAMAIAPSRGADVDGDGRVDLIGERPTPASDPIAPRFADVATFHEGRYTNASPSGRAWHARRARAAVSPSGAKDDARLRAAIERAWHTILAGTETAENVLRDLRREPAPPALRASFERHVREVATLSPGR